MEQLEIAQEFFASYAQALLARDPMAFAGHYAVPALIVSPAQLIAVSNAAQTEEFFTAAVQQYNAVTQAIPTLQLTAATQHTLWVEVSWEYDAAPPERYMYQLVTRDDTWQIAVLTPLADG